MSQQYYVNPREYQEERLNPWVLRFFLLAFTGVFLFIFSIVALIAGYQLMTQDQIHQGIAPIYGVDVAGMTRTEAVIALSDQPTYGDLAEFTFVYEGQEWTFTGRELGVDFNLNETINQAYNLGREGQWFQNLIKQFTLWREGHQVAPMLTYNRTQAETQLQALADNYINQSVQDATLTIQNRQALTTASQAGLQVDIPATLALLENEVIALNTRATLPLAVSQTQPALVDADEAAIRVNTALDERGVTFFIPAEVGADAGPWTAKVESIENMLRVERVEQGSSASYEAFVTLEQAREFLNQLSSELSRSPQEARFIFNDQTRQLDVIESSVNGRRLNVDATLLKFEQAVFNPDDRTVPLVFDEVVPTINNQATAADLGITELIQEATTYYLGSTPSRRANIQVSAAKFHGIVIKPGQEFSFNDWLGEVDLGQGYEEALIIVGGQTITGVGGGVCQVSTTVFQAAFYAGFPILERYPHGYRVGYYETGEGPGMDATVYSPTVDFRFLNDTPYHLLIETYVKPAQSAVTFRFYSTSMGRRVVKEGPVVKNERSAPPPVYRANPNLQAGEINQVEVAVSGSEVFVYRTIYQGDQIVVDKEQFYSNYIPWAAQFEVSPNDSRLRQ